jgi:hypothetical protein
MAARRCSNCGLNWPDVWKDYRKCPKCEGDLDPSGSDPMEDDEARSLKNHLEFERYWEKWELERFAAQAQILVELEASLPSEQIESA